MGDIPADKIVQWIIQHVECHEERFAFYPKRMIRCLDEYVTNPTEGMNYSAKHGSISAKPNDSLTKAVGAINSFDSVKSCERKHMLLSSATNTPLYVRSDAAHNDNCLRQLRPVPLHYTSGVMLPIMTIVYDNCVQSQYL